MLDPLVDDDRVLERIVGDGEAHGLGALQRVGGRGDGHVDRARHQRGDALGEGGLHDLRRHAQRLGEVVAVVDVEADRVVVGVARSHRREVQHHGAAQRAGADDVVELVGKRRRGHQRCRPRGRRRGLKLSFPLSLWCFDESLWSALIPIDRPQIKPKIQDVYTRPGYCGRCGRRIGRALPRIAELAQNPYRLQAPSTHRSDRRQRATLLSLASRGVVDPKPSMGHRLAFAYALHTSNCPNSAQKGHEMSEKETVLTIAQLSERVEAILRHAGLNAAQAGALARVHRRRRARRLQVARRLSHRGDPAHGEGGQGEPAGRAGAHAAARLRPSSRSNARAGFANAAVELGAPVLAAAGAAAGRRRAGRQRLHALLRALARGRAADRDGAGGDGHVPELCHRRPDRRQQAAARHQSLRLRLAPPGRAALRLRLRHLGHRARRGRAAPPGRPPAARGLGHRRRRAGRRPTRRRRWPAPCCPSAATRARRSAP